MKIGFKNIIPNTSSDESDLAILIKELDQTLPLFPTSDIFQRDYYEGFHENDYTETLIKFLENIKPSSRFTFFNQPSQKGRRTVDIGVYLKDNSEYYLFCIEAKFLPTADYITGECAAIKRFKLCEHGLSSRNPKKAKPLPENGIVAYVKKGTLDKHKTSINNKIIALSELGKADEFGLVWRKSEQLKNKLATKLISIHHRENANNVKLHHFWLKLP